jgi:predicted DNA-binding transcriptional regulator YafY
VRSTPLFALSHIKPAVTAPKHGLSGRLIRTETVRKGSQTAYMASSTRTLQLLGLLQQRRFWAGGDLAGRLEVSERTLRRDIDRLRSLGYDVAAIRGAAGGYQLQAGANLPPLLLDSHEAVALAIGLHAAAHNHDTGIAEASVSALAKLVSMLPVELRRKVELIDQVTESAGAAHSRAMPSPEVLGAVAQACQDHTRLSFDYRTRQDTEDGSTQQRYVEPLRLVTRYGRWYLVAFDIDRNAWRTFRLDRISNPAATRNTFTPRQPPAADIAAYVDANIRSLREEIRVVIDFFAPFETVQQLVGTRATIAQTPNGVRVTLVADTLDWPMRLLWSTDARFKVVEPAALQQRVDAFVARAARM